MTEEEKRKSSPVTSYFNNPAAVKPTPAPVKEEKPKVDVSWVAVGVTVGHAKFGSGAVTEMKGGLITVKFAEGEKKFQFPNAFEAGFLTKN